MALPGAGGGLVGSNVGATRRSDKLRAGLCCTRTVSPFGSVTLRVVRGELFVPPGAVLSPRHTRPSRKLVIEFDDAKVPVAELRQ
jgi:hypothetical protein